MKKRIMKGKKRHLALAAGVEHTVIAIVEYLQNNENNSNNFYHYK